MNKLKVPIAFLCVLLIWSSTPLAIQWSSTTAPLSSVLVRMLIGVMFCLSMMGLIGMKLPFDEKARQLYVIGGLSMFITMSFTYVAAQSVPSGWISIIFGLSPIITGLFSLFYEPENRFTILRIFGMCLGVSGLFLVFKAGIAFDTSTLPGISLLLIAMLVASVSAVLMRHLCKDSQIQPMQITTGGLAIAIPFFALSAYLIEPGNDINFSSKELLSILYLGLIGTGVGFTLYYFLLKIMSASKVALITLITPISSLLLGNMINNEPVIKEVWIGAIFVSIGLLLYEYRPKIGLRKI